MSNDVFRNTAFRIDEQSSQNHIIVRSDSYLQNKPWSNNQTFCYFNSKNEMLSLYLLLKKYLNIEKEDAKNTFYSKAIVNQSLLDTLEMLQEGNNEQIGSSASDLTEISRLICEFRSEFGLPDSKILKHMDCINNTIYYLEQMKK